ncbi:hypothetical protein D3C81_2012950 [compost metagenome]
MFAVEHRMDGSQANVFITTPIAGDKVAIEKLIIIRSGSLFAANDIIIICDQTRFWCSRVGNIIEERMSRPECI